MGLEVRACDAGLGENQRKDGSVGGMVVDGEVEAVGEKGPHHEAHLVDGRIGRSAGGDVEEFRRGVKGAGDPEGRAGFGDAGENAEAQGEFLRAGKLVGERNVAPECLVGRDKKAAGGGAGVVGTDGAVDVAGVEWDIGVLRAPGLVGRTEATSKASVAGAGALWAKAAEQAARMQTGSLNPNEGMRHLCSVLLHGLPKLDAISFGVG